MRNKMKISVLAFVVLAIFLVPSCFAATVLEDTADYTEGAIIYGSTRFEMDQVITAGVAFNAGINESKVWVALGNKLNDLEEVTPYYYDGATWYKITAEAAEEVAEEDIKEIEDNLHIFFVNNEMKTVEVPYDGNVDEGSVTEGAKYDKENKKFVVPALSFDFEFTDDGAKVEVNTNVDTNTEVTDPEDIKEPEIINSDVASIGDVKYEDLAKAFAEAKTGDTIKLLANIDLATGIEVNKKLTLNLNGKTLTAKKDTEGNGIFMVVTGGDLTIEGDGKIDSACLTNDYSMAVWVKGTGKLTINGGTFTNVGAKDMEDDGKTANNNEVIYVRDSGSAVINGGTFIGNTSNKTYGAGFTLNLRDADRATAKMIVKGGTFTGFNPADNLAENEGTNFVAEGYKVVVNGDKYTVVAYDANNIADEADLRYFIAKGGTVKLAADIKLQTNKALAIENDTVLDLNGKTLSIFDGYTKNNVMWTDANLTITGNGTIDARMTDKTYTYAVYAFGGGKVTIENGNFIGIHGLEDYECSLIYCQGANSLITILGGTFVGDDKFTLNLKDADYTSGVASIVVKGGTFTGFNPADNAAEGEHTNFVAEGYKVVVNGDKYTVVAYDANNVVNEKELRHFITNGTNVKLGADIDLVTGIEVAKKVTVNLNGKTLSSKKDTEGIGIFMVVTGGDLTIEGDGKIDSACLTNDYSMAIWVKETGKLTINGGTFTNVGAKDMEDDGKTANNNEVIYVRDSGLAVINGGTFIGNTSNRTYGAGFTLNLRDADRTTASIVVKGGTFTGFNPADNAAENAGTNFVAEGYKVVVAGDKYTVIERDPVNNVANEEDLRYYMLKGGEVTLGADIKLNTNKTIGLEKDLVLDLNGHTISVFEGYTKNNVMWTSANLTITGNGTIDARMNDHEYTYALYAWNGGNITIENGNFIGIHGLEDYECALIYCQGAGSLITILDGTFVGDDVFTLNVSDAHYKDGTANIVVKGGTFTGFNPADNAAEGEHTNFVAEGYRVKYNEAKNTYTVVAYDANNVTSEAELRYFMKKGGTVKLGADLDLTTAVPVSSKVTLDLNGKTITSKNDPNGDGLFMVVTGGDLTINGEGTLDAACQTNEYSMVIWAKETGKVTINGGTYTNVGAKSINANGKTNNNDMIYARDNAEITINGGTFIGNTANVEYGPRFTLNLRDADRATAKMIVKGGTFTGFNPADNLAENEGTNFVAEGYGVAYNEATDTYTVAPIAE